MTAASVIRRQQVSNFCKPQRDDWECRISAESHVFPSVRRFVTPDANWIHKSAIAMSKLRELGYHSVDCSRYVFA